MVPSLKIREEEEKEGRRRREGQKKERREVKTRDTHVAHNTGVARERHEGEGKGDDANETN